MNPFYPLICRNLPKRLALINWNKKLFGWNYYHSWKWQSPILAKIPPYLSSFANYFRHFSTIRIVTPPLSLWSSQLWGNSFFRRCNAKTAILRWPFVFGTCSNSLITRCVIHFMSPWWSQGSIRLLIWPWELPLI